MKIATWNVNSIRARFDRLLAWLERQQPDAVCLQETKVIDDDFPAAELEAAGYQAAFHGQKSYNGVALLARTAIEDVVNGFADGADENDARVIAGTISGVRVVSVYVPNGKDVGTDAYQYKLEWFERLRRYFDAREDPKGKVVLAGDFNVAPDDRDVYDPERLSGSILCSEPERIKLRNVVEWGFTDSFRKHHQDDGLFSWWDYRRLGFPKNRGLRIDHVYLTQSLEQVCSGSFIDRDERKGKGPSDHAPVFAELDL
ncbi:MAG: exodeoxyribonuclease III [Deltaproteobacteria bacterium]|jgi:exodeoxyribonuclease-3|nr:exodeoxyribonuclease III [Deltaproteobacteria bacterium]